MASICLVQPLMPQGHEGAAGPGAGARATTMRAREVPTGGWWQSGEGQAGAAKGGGGYRS